MDGRTAGSPEQGANDERPEQGANDERPEQGANDERPEQGANDEAPEPGEIGLSPALALQGFTGPLERLLVLARAHQVNVAMLSLSDFCDQLGAALQRASGRIPLSQRGEWLAMGAWLLLLRSRLLLPTETPAAPASGNEKDTLPGGRAGVPDIQNLAAWLAHRPQLGHNVFVRGRPEWGGEAGQGFADPYQPHSCSASIGIVEHQVDVIEFLWACMMLFDADLPAPETAPRYRPAWLDLHAVADARARILRLLTGTADGLALAGLLPEATPDAPPPAALKRRSAWTSTFVAGLELAKQGEVLLHQENDFETIHVARPVAACH